MNVRRADGDERDRDIQESSKIRGIQWGQIDQGIIHDRCQGRGCSKSQIDKDRGAMMWEVAVLVADALIFMMVPLIMYLEDRRTRKERNK